MGENESDRSMPILKPTLSFFKEQLSYLNDKRLLLNRGKGLAKYFATSQIRNLAPLDTTLGVMSFSLYMLRFLANVGLLVELMLIEPQEKINHQVPRDLYFSLVNDSLWCVVNLSQFFWLSYRNSSAAGLKGMQLETLAQLIDLLVMIIRYQQDKEEYNTKYHQASAIERAHLKIEWQRKELNIFRALLMSLSLIIVYALFSFSAAAISLSPIIFTLSMVSALFRIFIDIQKDRQLIAQLKRNEMHPQHILNEELALTNARMKDLNQIILNSVFLPMGLFLLLTTPLSLTIMACLSMVLIQCLFTHFINAQYPPLVSTNYRCNTVSGG